MGDKTTALIGLSDNTNVAIRGCNDSPASAPDFNVFNASALAGETLILDLGDPTIAAYRPGLFQSQAFFGYAHALAPHVVTYTPQESQRGLSTE